MMTGCQTRLRIFQKKAVLEIERPQALNALNCQVLREIQAHCQELQANNAVNALIICGAGDKAFISGADIKEMENLKTSDDAKSFAQLGVETLHLIEHLPQITIARVQGFALGGGLELALACDFIIAAQKACFALPEVQLGIIPGFAGTQRLARRLGTAKAIEFITTASKYTATEALHLGLVNHVVPNEELIAFTDHIVDKILTNGPQAVRSAKQVIQKGMNLNFQDACAEESRQFALLFKNTESKEGLKAFVEKRSPQF
jgi:enoyl-CoA hydratase